jgi:hypothetical protein
MKLKQLLCALSLGVSFFGWTSLAVAQEEMIGDDGYNKTYNDPSKTFQERMKESREVPKITYDNSKGGLALGLVAGFGPLFDTEPKSNSGMGYGLGVEVGYIMQSDSWNRMELTFEASKQTMSWKRTKNGTATMDPMLILPKIGLAHSLGGNMFGMTRFGFGFATGEMFVKEVGVTESTDNKMGFVLSGDYDVAYGVGLGQFYGGLGVRHYRFAFSETTVGNTTTSDDTSLVLNNVNLHFGARLKF